MVVPFGEGGYYAARPTIAIARPGATGRRARSRRLLRPASAPRAAACALHARAAGDRPRVRLARRHAVALRRAGLHGDRHAGREEHAGRLAEPATRAAAATPSSRRRSAPSRSRRSCRASLQGPAPALAMASIDRIGGGRRRRDAGASFEAQYAAAADPVLRQHRTRGVRRDEDAARGRREGPPRTAGDAAYPRSPFGEALRQIAQLIKADVGLEVAFAEIGGWDTHVNEGGADGPARRPPRRLRRGLAALRHGPRRPHGRTSSS